jgi:thiamine pyrophosphokinase
MPPGPHVVVLADGEAPTRSLLDRAWPGWDHDIAVVVAADGGAVHAATLGLRVDRWVGDGDSIDPALLGLLEAAGVDIRRVPIDKDATDAELALAWATEAGAGAVTIIGALGGSRIDHALANVELLGHPAIAGRPAVMYDRDGARLSLLVAPDPVGGAVTRALAGRLGDLVSLIPLGGSARGVTTDGLQFPLRGEELAVGRTRGVSNVRTRTPAGITLESGRLLVIETPANLRP